MRVVFTNEAEADLEEIGDYISSDNPTRAVTFVEEIQECCLGLGENAARFQLIDRRPHHDVRRRVHGAYLIFYRIAADRVEVLRILHGARDYEQLLFPDAPN